MEFIPYIPQHTQQISSDEWAIAHTSWLLHLTTLLDSPDSEFIEHVLHNASLHIFVAAVLADQLDRGQVSLDLLRPIMLIHVRAGQLASQLSSSPLLSVEALCHVAVVFGPNNRALMRKVFDQCHPFIREALDRLFVALLATLHDDAPAEVLTIVARSLEAMTAVVADGPFQQIQDNLVRYYENSTLHGKDTASTYLIKRTLVSTFQHTLERLFFEPLGVDVVAGQRINQQHQRGDPDAVIDALNACIFHHIETSNVDTAHRAYVDGPLVMDWQVQYNASDMIALVNRLIAHGQDDRLEFLKLSLEQVRDMNTGEDTWGKLLAMQHRQQGQESTAASDLDKTSRHPAAEMPVEMLSRISQIQDLFPDLGEGFIAACLAACNQDAEQVVAHLLEDSLPPQVASLDRSMKHVPAPTPAPEPAPVSREPSILDTRHNIYDNDEFDLLSKTAVVDKSKIHVGKKDRGTADKLLKEKAFEADEKAQMLERIYNMYEDEYDDTYDDINEVSGPVDLGAVQDQDQALDIVAAKPAHVDPGIQYESDLVHTYMEDPAVFARSAAARRSPKREQLRKLTKMSDEQLEGWSIMFERNPRKQRILDKYMLFDGKQAEVTPKVQQAQKSQHEKKDTKPVDEARQRAYKDKNKARFANHNRKRGHDKKLAKAGVGPSS